jgi:hypothetical protein
MDNEIEFKVGDVVYLRSDIKRKTPMTIREIDWLTSTQLKAIRVVFLSTGNILQRESFDSFELIMK